MSESGSELTKYVRDVLQKEPLDHIKKSFETAVESYALDEYQGLRAFGMAAWENRYKRFMEEIVPSPDNSFEPAELSASHYVPALRHPKWGLIILHLHTAEPGTYLPKNGSAKAARDNAVLSTPSLFEEETEARRHVFVAVVGSPIKGLQEVVVGELLRSQPGSQHFSLINKQFLELGVESAIEPVAPEELADPAVTRREDPVQEPVAKPEVQRSDQSGKDADSGTESRSQASG